MGRRITYKELYAFYNSYQWAKCNYADFRRRAVTQKRPFEVAIRPENLREPLSAEKLFYDNYQGEKCLKPTFISRVRSGLSFEEAISPVLIKPKFERKPCTVPYTPTYTQKVLSPRAVIDITLSSEEAEVFRKEYKRLKADLEHRLATCELPSEHRKLEQELKYLQEEIAVFNQRN